MADSSFQSSINLNIAQTPDFRNISDPKSQAIMLNDLYNAVHILQGAIDTYTGNTPSAPNNWTSTDPGSVNTIANGSKFYLTAAVDIAAGLLVGIDTTGKAVLADAASGVWAIGVATSAITTGNVVEIVLLGCLNIYATGTFTPGTKYYVGAAGHFAAAPTAVGSMIQCIGWAYLDTAIYLNPSVDTTTVPTPPTP